MKKPALYLLILLLTAALVLTVIARQEPAAVQTMSVGGLQQEADEATAVPEETTTAPEEPAATPEKTAVPEEATAAPEEPAATPADTSAPEAVGGEMSLTVPGYGGDVTVSIVVDENGVITAMTADVSAESPELGRKCGEEWWLAQFIGRKAPFALAGEAADGVTPVDAVSNATITSRALTEAVNALLAPAEMNPDVDENP